MRSLLCVLPLALGFGAAAAQTNLPALPTGAELKNNPFERAAQEAYAGRWEGKEDMKGNAVGMRLVPDGLRWKGNLTFQGQTMPLEAGQKAGRLEGTYSLNQDSFPFSARVEGDTLTLGVGRVTATLHRQKLPNFDGPWMARKVRVLFENKDGQISGRIQYEGGDYPFTAKAEAGDLTGSFRNGPDLFPFTIVNEAGRVTFQTGPFSEVIHPAFSTGAKLTNSLGMELVKVPGTTVRFCAWETRVKDYQVYAEATAGVDGSWRNVESRGVGVSSTPAHPVTMVSWEDAVGFCKWLTDKERAEGLLGPEQAYRLPTDAEWSKAVGLDDEAGGSPKEKDRKVKDAYPWGSQWPPPKGAGNYADQSAKARFPDWAVIEGYDDGFATTAPVGSFQPNRHGLFDLGGNVWEWCDDWYDADQKLRVVRGGSWGNRANDLLLSSYRYGRTTTPRSSYVGFRVVLAGGAPL